MPPLNPIPPGYVPPRNDSIIFMASSDAVERLCTILILEDAFLYQTYHLNMTQVRCLTRLIALQWERKTRFVHTSNLAFACGCTERTVCRSINVLKAAGLIEEGDRRDGSRFLEITPMLEQFQKYIEKLGKEV